MELLLIFLNFLMSNVYTILVAKYKAFILVYVYTLYSRKKNGKVSSGQKLE